MPHGAWDLPHLLAFDQVYSFKYGFFPMEWQVLPLKGPSTLTHSIEDQASGTGNLWETNHNQSIALFLGQKYNWVVEK